MGSIEHGSLSGDFLGFVVRLAFARSSGVLVVQHGGSNDVLVLRQGFLVCPETDALGRLASSRLESIVNCDTASYRFDANVAACPPGSSTRKFSLISWARRFLDARLDAHAVDKLRQAHGSGRVPVDRTKLGTSQRWDDIDQKILLAMEQAPCLDDVAALAGAPTFRVLSLLNFISAIGALKALAQPRKRRRSAGDTLTELASRGECPKRVYRRLARQLHPDLHPNASPIRRRQLERELASLTETYRNLRAGSP